MNALHTMKCNMVVNRSCDTHFYFDMGIYKIEPFDIDDNHKLIFRALYVANVKSPQQLSPNPANPFLNFLN